ncbi:MAG: DUF1294 domain-containing protein [Phycisphaeraceae bacterium]|nr:DUF1294 domain-containing protein [Phycisphaeraceae bacterium]MCB9848074.1 DUF1294 domain-containing protein [Phycisphaeraceae bacterium]
MNPVVIGVVIGVYGAMSVVAFLAYAVDKRAAALGNRRIPEARLHLLELCFGWPGALLARRLLRHKTLKRGYSAVFWAIGAAHLVGWGAVVWWMVRGSGAG